MRGTEEWRELLEGKRAAPREGRGEPMNIRRRPIVEPPMVNVKDGVDLLEEEPEDEAA